MMKWTSRQVFTLALGAVLGVMSMSTVAAMIPLNSDQLSSVTGEGTGVQISLSMQLNGTMSSTTGWTPSNDATNPSANGKGCFSSATSGAPGGNSAFCRFGFQENNVYNWLLLKGFNGFVDVPQLIVFGSYLPTTQNPSGQTMVGFQINMPAIGQAGKDVNGNLSQININNLSATFAMAVNTACYTSAAVDNGTCSSASAATMALNNQNTYLDPSKFQSTSSTQQNYSVPDSGKETGIMAIRITGNLNVGGTIYAFAKQN